MSEERCTPSPSPSEQDKDYALSLCQPRDDRYDWALEVIRRVRADERERMGQPSPEAHTDWSREVLRICTGSKKGHLPSSLPRLVQRAIDTAREAEETERKARHAVESERDVLRLELDALRGQPTSQGKTEAVVSAARAMSEECLNEGYMVGGETADRLEDALKAYDEGHTANPLPDYREKWETVSRLLRDVVDDCAPPEHHFNCVCCGAHHTADDDGDLSCSVSKAMHALDAPEHRMADAPPAAEDRTAAGKNEKP